MGPAVGKRLRHAIIGVGAAVFNGHRPGLQLETVELVGVSDVNAERGLPRAEQLGCPFFADYHTMLAQTRPDVAVIMAPHPFHAQMAIDCLRAGCHVLVEKPIAVQVAEADAMIQTAEQAGRLLAVCFQQRLRPEVRAAHKLIAEGRLGAIQHVAMSVTWMRPAIYYRLAPWRGTWTGEGGGLLMNQAPHNLDLLCHLAGMPSRVFARTRTTLHRIETEDTVQAMLEWPNGAMGSLHASTAEVGPPERLEIVGTGGYLRIGQGALELQQPALDVQQYLVESSEPYSAPPLHPAPVELDPGAGDHVAVYRNLHEAILHGAPLNADGGEGRMSLELANAMIYSSYTGHAVDLPLDRQKYAALLAELQAQSGR